MQLTNLTSEGCRLRNRMSFMADGDGDHVYSSHKSIILPRKTWNINTFIWLTRVICSGIRLHTDRDILYVFDSLRRTDLWSHLFGNKSTLVKLYVFINLRKQAQKSHSFRNQTTTECIWFTKKKSRFVEPFGNQTTLVALTASVWLH